MDTVTALSGSGPAYFFALVEALEAAAVAQGLPRDTARALAAQTCLGAGRMLVDGGEDPAVLRQRVTSPNGTTQAALESFAADGLPRITARAVAAATRRGVELAAELDTAVVSYLLNALSMLIELAFEAVVTLLLLRVAAEACRADFNNPLSQFVYRYTNPVLAPIRRVLPNWRRINLAALLLAWLVMLLKRLLLFALLGVMPHPVGLLVLALAELLDFALLFYLVLIFGWSLLSMFAVDRRQPLLRLAGSIVAPAAAPAEWQADRRQHRLRPDGVMIVLLLATPADRRAVAGPRRPTGDGCVSYVRHELLQEPAGGRCVCSESKLSPASGLLNESRSAQRPLDDDAMDRIQSVEQRRRSRLQDDRRLDLVQVAMAHRRNRFPTRPRSHCLGPEALAAP